MTYPAPIDPGFQASSIAPIRAFKTPAQGFSMPLDFLESAKRVEVFACP
jgi:hypothetical protein